MLNFESDYLAGAHPKILENLQKANFELQTGYGMDPYTESAKKRIKQACQDDDAEIFFLVGGTQTNETVISTMLAPYEGVLSAVTGHINGHEAGAVEYTGHKILPLPQYKGKIKAEDLLFYLESFSKDGNQEHMVYPGMLYISHPTEYGTLYSLDELKEIHSICQRFEIPLFLDGARLGYGLMSHETDVTLPDLAKYTDVFYIGGTKVGAMFGEAVVFTHKNAPKHFYTMTKQHGAMLAKGWITGLQFDTLFTDDLYFKISRNAIDLACRMKKILLENGYQFFIETPTNQQFVILEDSELKEMEKEVLASFWEKPDQNHTVVRFATSWATTDKDMDQLEEVLKKLKNK